MTHAIRVKISDLVANFGSCIFTQMYDHGFDSFSLEVLQAAALELHKIQSGQYEDDNELVLMLAPLVALYRDRNDIPDDCNIIVDMEEASYEDVCDRFGLNFRNQFN